MALLDVDIFMKVFQNQLVPGAINEVLKKVNLNPPPAYIYCTA